MAGGRKRKLVISGTKQNNGGTKTKRTKAQAVESAARSGAGDGNAGNEADPEVQKSAAESSENLLDANANIAGVKTSSALTTSGTKMKVETMNLKEVKSSILSILGDWKKPNTHAVGKLEDSIPPPNLVVDGFGCVPLPVNGVVASELVKHMERSPYGHGEKTVTDPEYRNSHQLGPEKFQIKNQKFTEAVNKVVETVAKEFHFSPFNVSAKLYKFLLYETGGLFKPHKDTEKDHGMFATLIIQLPSLFTGGTFKVEHNGKTKKFDLCRQGSDVSSFYVAHFASCTHELTKIKTGQRAALVYNLCWTGTTTIPPQPPGCGLPDAGVFRQLITSYLDNTKKAEFGGNALRLVWLLEHDYTDKAMMTHGLKALKGKDVFVFKQLMETNKGQKGDDLFKILLAEATKTENGECGTHEYSRRSGKCFMRECSDSYTELENFICLSEYKPETEPVCLFKTLDINPEKDVLNFVREDTFWGKSKSAKCEGYTGNEGAPMEQQYSRRVLVVYSKASERKIAFRQSQESAVEKLLQGMKVKGKKLTEEEKECVLTCKFTGRQLHNIALLAYRNADPEFMKQVVVKISETAEGFGSGSERRQRYGYQDRGMTEEEAKEDETGLSRCLKLYKKVGDIDDLEPYLVRMILAVGEKYRKDESNKYSLSCDWEHVEECMKVVDDVLPTKDVYGNAIFELFFELMPFCDRYGYGSSEKSRYEKVVTFLMTKYPDIVTAKLETMFKSTGLRHPFEVASLIPVFQASNLEKKDEIVERMVVGTLEFVMPKWIEAQTKRTGYGYYYNSGSTYEAEVKKVTEVLLPSARLIQLMCKKFSGNAQLDCVGNWIDWVFDKNFQQLVSSPHFRQVVENRILALRLVIPDAIPEPVAKPLPKPMGKSGWPKTGWGKSLRGKQSNQNQNQLTREQIAQNEKRIKLLNTLTKLRDRLNTMN